MLRKFDTRRHTPVAGQSRYRVILLRANGQVALVSMTLARIAAIKLAREVVDQHLHKLETNWRYIISCPNRPREIYVQVWIGTAFQGAWETLLPQNGGYHFGFHDRPRRKKRSGFREPGKEATPTRKTKTLVQCVLLPKKTRRGGWRAQISGTEHEGPVTNWQDIPSHLAVGDSVELKLCGVSKQTGAAQFAWTG